MIAKLCLFFVISVAWSLPTNEVSPRIYNGFKAEKGQFPWQAALFIPTNYNLRFCGGVIISEWWVLTAAHCLWRGYFNVRVVVGTTKSNGDDPAQVEFHSQNYFIMEEYDPWSYENDVGLVKLLTAITFNDFIKPILLAYTFEDDVATASGWGDTGDGSRSVDLTYTQLTASVCTNENTKICTTPDPESEAQNICGGDSGSGLVLNPSDYPVLVGIASTYSGSCSENRSAEFTNVAKLRSWISENTGIP